MLWIKIPDVESWDEGKEEFVTTFKGPTLKLEHSLISVSKWESKWCRPFISNGPATVEETIDYIKCMTLTQNVSQEVYDHLSKSNIEEIQAYIAAPMTATTFSEDSKNKGKREIITNELIYYWMTALNIPVEFEKWHLNRLLTLVRVCNIKNQPPKKMSRKETASQYAALNAARRQKYNSKG